MDISELANKNKEEMIAIAGEMGITDHANLAKQNIIMRLLQAQAEQQGYIFSSGILDIMGDGYGFLRQRTLLPSQNDVYVSQSQIRRFGLRTGDMVAGQGRAPKRGDKYYSLLRVEAVNDLNPQR